MGTRSLTYIFSNNEKSRTDQRVSPIVCMYRQYDGYPTGHGRELAEWLVQIRLINGIPMGVDSNLGVVANGMGCLAAQMVAHFKTEVGQFYLQSTNVEENAEHGWQDYEYEIYPDFVRVFSLDKLIFDGTWNAFSFWTKLEEPEEYEGEYDKYSEKTDQDQLREKLRECVLNVVFTKADGNVREMVCTTNPDQIPADKLPKSASGGVSDPDLFKVYDLEKEAWRSFRWESIKSVIRVE